MSKYWQLVFYHSSWKRSKIYYLLILAQGTLSIVLFNSHNDVFEIGISPFNSLENPTQTDYWLVTSAVKWWSQDLNESKAIGKMWGRELAEERLKSKVWRWGYKTQPAFSHNSMAKHLQLRNRHPLSYSELKLKRVWKSVFLHIASPLKRFSGLKENKSRCVCLTSNGRSMWTWTSHSENPSAGFLHSS